MTKFQGLNYLAYGTYTQQRKQTMIYQGGGFGDQKSLWKMAIHHTFVRGGVCNLSQAKDGLCETDSHER